MFVSFLRGAPERSRKRKSGEILPAGRSETLYWGCSSSPPSDLLCTLRCCAQRARGSTERERERDNIFECVYDALSWIFRKPDFLAFQDHPMKWLFIFRSGFVLTGPSWGKAWERMGVCTFFSGEMCDVRRNFYFRKRDSEIVHAVLKSSLNASRKLLVIVREFLFFCRSKSRLYALGKLLSHTFGSTVLSE